MDNNFKEFLIQLFTKMSTGDFTILVKCADDKIFPADVIGYSEEYMTIEVMFHSDELQKPGRKEVPGGGFGYGTSEETIMVDCMIPVKREKIWWENIQIN
jgi:hypothetical protein